MRLRRLAVWGVLLAIALPFTLSFLIPLHYTRGLITKVPRVPAQDFLLRDGRFLWLSRTFIPGGDPEINIIRITNKDGRLYKWRVFDTGNLMPIDPDDRDYLFDHYGPGPLFMRVQDMNLPPLRYRKLVLSAWVPGIPIIAIAAYPTSVLICSLVVPIYRKRRGKCTRCGYNLTGNMSGVCPECGERI